MAVFSTESFSPRLESVGQYTLELIHFKDVQSFSSIAYTQPEMIVVRDYPTMDISSLIKSADRNVSHRYLKAEGRKALVRSIFYQDTARRLELTSALLSAMWLKIAAFEFSTGMLKLAGYTPMPTHELGQLRSLPLKEAAVQGIELALEAVGIERASRAIIARFLPAVAELLGGNYDRDLVLEKAKTLLEKQMISDCYYYIGRVISGYLVTKKSDPSLFSEYSRLIQIALDLSSDQAVAQKHRSGLFRAASDALKAS